MTKPTFTVPCTLLIAASSSLLTLAFTGCAVDSEEDTVEETASAVTTKYDECAVNHAANAFEDYIGSTVETYTRKGDSTINYDCDCRAWQIEANNLGETQASIDHPLCRPETIVNAKWEVWNPILAWEAKVPSWTLSNGETECLNSTLVVSFWKETSPNVFTFQFQTTKHPTMLSDGTCSPLSITGGGAADGNRYRIKALATRGLNDKNHGFETVKISTYGYSY